MSKHHDRKFGELLDAAMHARTQAEADEFFAAIVARLERTSSTPKTRAEYEAIARDNLGYWAGYSSHETRARVEPLYRCEHPVFGSIAECGVPDSEWAFKAGVRIATATTPAERAAVYAELKRELRELKALQEAERGQ